MVNYKSNPEIFQEQIASEFKKFKWPENSTKNGCQEINNNKFELNNTQKFIGTYFTEKNPNGILLFHSVGSGKTLSATNIIKNFQEKGFNAVWITRGTLKKDLDKALTLLPTPKAFPVFSYKQLSNICKKKGENYKYLIEKAKKAGANDSNTDPFYKSVVIVDEAHKLYTKDLKPQEQHDIKAIESAFFNSYSNSGENRLRLCLMSGTPIAEDPRELLRLLNLIIQEKKNRFDIEPFYKNFVKDSLVDPELQSEFKEKTKGLVSFLDASKNASTFAQVKITEVLVPISKESQEAQIDCKEVYKTCMSSGFTKLDCTEAKQSCAYKNKIKKEAAGKDQTTILKKRCSISL
jgi:hypothetical protein